MGSGGQSYQNGFVDRGCALTYNSAVTSIGGAGVMALPDQLKNQRITGASIVKDFPSRLSELENAIAAIFGIPVDTLIAAAGSEFVAAGMRKLILQDLAGDPSDVGQIVRSGTRLKAHNGSVQDLAYLSDTRIVRSTNEPLVINDAV